MSWESDILRKLRNERSMTQAQFAEWLEIPKRTYEKWESGERVPPQWVISLIKFKCEKSTQGKQISIDNKEIYVIENNGEIQYVYTTEKEARKWESFCKNISKYKEQKYTKVT